MSSTCEHPTISRVIEMLPDDKWKTDALKILERARTKKQAQDDVVAALNGALTTVFDTLEALDFGRISKGYSRKVSCCIESLEEVQSTISEAAKRNMKDPKKIFAAMKKSVDALDRTKTFYKMIRCKVDHVVQDAIKRSVETITAATAAYRSTYDTSTPGRTEQYASYYPIFGEAAGIDTKHAGSNMPYQTKLVRYIVDITMWGVTELREIHIEYKAKTALFEMMVAFEPKAAELIWPETAKKKNKRTPPSLSGKKRQLSETDSDDAPSMMSDALNKRMSTSAIEESQGSPTAVHETVAQQPRNPHMNGVAPSTSMQPGQYQGYLNQSTGFDSQSTAMVSLRTPRQYNPNIPTPTTTLFMPHGNPVGEPSYQLLGGGEMKHSNQVVAPLETFRIQPRQTWQPMVGTTEPSGNYSMQPVSTNRALGLPDSAWSNAATTVTPIAPSHFYGHSNGQIPSGNVLLAKSWSNDTLNDATATRIASMDSLISFSPLSLSPGPAPANSYQTNPEPPSQMTYVVDEEDWSGLDSPIYMWTTRSYKL